MHHAFIQRPATISTQFLRVNSFRWMARWQMQRYLRGKTNVVEKKEGFVGDPVTNLSNAIPAMEKREEEHPGMQMAEMKAQRSNR